MKTRCYYNFITYISLGYDACGDLHNDTRHESAPAHERRVPVVRHGVCHDWTDAGRAVGVTGRQVGLGVTRVLCACVRASTLRGHVQSEPAHHQAQKK